MSQDDSHERKVLTRKELAREQRRQAYKKAKQQRANDPRVIAMKEALKVRRREIYQQFKARRKAEAATQKSSREQAQRERTTEVRAAKDAELMQLITFTAKGSNAQN